MNSQVSGQCLFTIPTGNWENGSDCYKTKQFPVGFWDIQFINLSCLPHYRYFSMLAILFPTINATTHEY